MKNNLIYFMLLIFSIGFGVIGAKESHNHDHEKHQTHIVTMDDKKMKGHENHVQDHEKSVSADINNEKCIVMGGKTNKKYSYTYKGKKYYFCCSSCIEVFSKNPEKYLKKSKSISLEAYQFGFDPEEIKVKKDDVVVLNMTSRDVPHGIHIAEYDINVTVKKGEESKIEFIADKKGSFDILCSVYCGRKHHDMKAKLIVE
jgi:cytochrome c oxidase subunit II